MLTSLLLLSIGKPTQALDIRSHIAPFITFVIGSLSYFSSITDHFMPATKQELITTKKEIQQILEDNAKKMHEHAQKNIQKNCAQTKKEVETKIDLHVAACYQQSHEIKYLLASLQKKVSNSLEKNHLTRMESLKKDIIFYTTTTHHDIEALQQKLTLTHNERNKLIEQQSAQLLAVLSNLKKKLDQKAALTQQQIHSRSRAQTTLIKNHHAQKKNEHHQLQEKSTYFFAETNKKIDTLERLCCILKNVVTEEKRKNRDLYKQIVALKSSNSNSYVKTAFGSPSSFNHYLTTDQKL